MGLITLGIVDCNHCRATVWKLMAIAPGVEIAMTPLLLSGTHSPFGDASNIMMVVVLSLSVLAGLPAPNSSRRSSFQSLDAEHESDDLLDFRPARSVQTVSVSRVVILAVVRRQFVTLRWREYVPEINDQGLLYQQRLPPATLSPRSPELPRDQ
jgi:hypothetical protein